MTRYFHRTTEGAAAAILKGGFKDGTGTYLTGHLHSGVWISNVALDENEGARGEVVVVVDIPKRLIKQYEWVEEGKGYREFLVPAKVLNTHGRVRLRAPRRRLAMRLRQFRKVRGITQEALAARAGIPRVYLAKLETQRQDSRLSILVKLARALKVKVDDLVD